MSAHGADTQHSHAAVTRGSEMRIAVSFLAHRSPLHRVQATVSILVSSRPSSTASARYRNRIMGKSAQPDAVNAWQKDDDGKAGKPGADATPGQVSSSRAAGNEKPHSDTDKAEHRDMHKKANEVRYGSPIAIADVSRGLGSIDGTLRSTTERRQETELARYQVQAESVVKALSRCTILRVAG